MGRLAAVAGIVAVVVLLLLAFAPPAEAHARTGRSRAVARVAPASSSPVWDRLAGCESGGRWNLSTGNRYYGGVQFSRTSWRAVGGHGYPHHASKGEQIDRARRLFEMQGWGAWPGCSRKLGLRLSR